MLDFASDGITLRSDVPGRQRWEVPALYRHPRYAAAVEMAIEKTSGVKEVKASTVTARLLVIFDAAVPIARVTGAIHRAIRAVALTAEAYAARQEALVALRQQLGDPDAPPSLRDCPIQGSCCDARDPNEAIMVRYKRKLWIGGVGFFLSLTWRLIAGAAAGPAFVLFSGIFTVI